MVDILNFIFKTIGDFIKLSLDFKIIGELSLLHIQGGILILLLFIKLLTFDGEYSTSTGLLNRQENTKDKRLQKRSLEKNKKKGYR